MWQITPDLNQIWLYTGLCTGVPSDNSMVRLGWVKLKIGKPTNHCCPAYVSHQIPFFGNFTINEPCDLQVYLVRFGIFSVLG